MCFVVLIIRLSCLECVSKGTNPFPSMGRWCISKIYVHFYAYCWQKLFDINKYFFNDGRVLWFFMVRLECVSKSTNPSLVWDSGVSVKYMFVFFAYCWQELFDINNYEFQRWTCFVVFIVRLSCHECVSMC